MGPTWGPPGSCRPQGGGGGGGGGHVGLMNLAIRDSYRWYVLPCALYIELSKNEADSCRAFYLYDVHRLHYLFVWWALFSTLIWTSLVMTSCDTLYINLQAMGFFLQNIVTSASLHGDLRFFFSVIDQYGWKATLAKLENPVKFQRMVWVRNQILVFGSKYTQTSKSQHAYCHCIHFSIVWG